MGSTTVRVDESLLGRSERLATGAQTIVHTAPDLHMPWASSLVYKQYRPAVLGELDVATLEAMAGYPETLAPAQRTELLSVAAWPCRLVEDRACVSGVVLPAVPPAFYLDMRRGAVRQRVLGAFEHLLTGESFLTDHRIPLADRQRYQLLLGVANALAVFHGHGIAVGDLSPQHLLAGNQSLRDPDRLLPSVPEDVRSLISGSLSPNPAKRPAPSAWEGALVAAVDSASTRLPGEPMSRAEAAASTPLSSLNAPSLQELAPPAPSGPRPAPAWRPGNWWQRRSRLEQAGAVASAIVVLGLVGVLGTALIDGGRTVNVEPDGREAGGDAGVGHSWVQASVPDDPVAFDEPGGQAMRSVVAGGPGLVAVGYDDDAEGREGVAVVWTSTDGREWSPVPDDAQVFDETRSQLMRSVVAAQPGLVAVGSDLDLGAAAVWTSSDGQRWSRVPHDPTAFGGGGGHAMFSVAQGGPGLVAVGADSAGNGGVAAVWTSPDGRTWSRVAHDSTVFGSAGVQVMSSVVEGEAGLVAVGAALRESAAVWVGE